MSKFVYFVHEEDGHRNHDTKVIKFASPFKRDANNFYEEYKEYYLDDDEDWNLVLSKYNSDDGHNNDSNIFRELETIKTTEDDRKV